MNTNLSSLVTAALFACGIPCQSVPVAYPQDSITISQGSNAPFGNLVPNFAEMHMQMLVPASWLPSTGATITGMAMRAIAGGGTSTYASLQIDVSHTAATSLGLTFAANLPAPQNVLQATNLTIVWPANQWTEIPFTTPFVYDGSSQIVFDVRTVNAPGGGFLAHQVPGNPVRTDLPPGPMVFGPLGSGTMSVAAATQLTPPLQFRVMVAGTPTMTLRSDRGGAANNTFAIGTTVSVNIHAPAGRLYGTLINFAYLPAPQPIPPLAGSAWVLGDTFFLGITGGPVTTNGLFLPNDSGFIGLSVKLQSAVVDLATLTGVFTCAGDFFLRP